MEGDCGQQTQLRHYFFCPSVPKISNDQSSDKTHTNTHSLAICFSIPADGPGTFFRVNMNLSMSGSPTKPKDIIENWVRDSNDCTQKLSPLK